IDFSLRECIREAIAALAINARQKGLGMGFDVATEVSDQVIGDPVRLRQVLLNLLNNAIKFTYTGSVELRATLYDRREDAITVHFSVTATGVGIPPDKLDKIFGAFCQADSSTSRKSRGTRLG